MASSSGVLHFFLLKIKINIEYLFIYNCVARENEGNV
jgi:hypothetical protein